MSTEQTKRLEILRSLLAMAASPPEIAQQLSRFSVDYEGEGVELTSAHLRHVLHQYIDGKVPASDVETWANMIEGRDDVSVAAGSQDMIESVLHELANPYLTYQLNTGRAAHLLGFLNAERTDG